MGQYLINIIQVIALILIIFILLKLILNHAQATNAGNGEQTTPSKFRTSRTDEELLDGMRQMSPTAFEHFIADLFSRFGYETQAVGGIHDEGIDVIAKKDDITNYIQCKKYITRKVSLKNIRDFYGAVIDFLGEGTGYLITTNTFTNETQRFAKGRQLILIDKFYLLEYVHSAKIEDHIPESEHPSGENHELCPRCENPLVERQSKHGVFLGCSTFPKCWYRKKK